MFIFGPSRRTFHERFPLEDYRRLGSTRSRGGTSPYRMLREQRAKALGLMD